MLLFQTQTRTQRPTINDDDLNKVVQAFNDYFIVRRDKYLSQYKKDGIGCTVTTTYDKNKPTTFVNLPLNDTLLKRHIRGKTNENYGIFATQSGYVKAISFDIDFADDKNMARWYTHKLHHVLLHDLALDDTNILINRSGLKGYHVHIFVDSLVHVDKVKKLYNHILRLISVQDDVQLPKPLRNYIEWKGNASHGIKLPLCRHIVNDVRASFVDNYTLKDIDDTAILAIKKLTLQQFNHTLERLDDYLDVDISNPSKLDDKELITQAKELVDSVKPLPIYKLGHDKEYTASYYNELLQFGLKSSGTRHNSCFMLAVHLKNEFGMTKNETITTLNEWITRQDKSLYSTKLDTCFQENRRICDYVYEKDIHINVQEKLIEVTKSELKTILTAKNKDNKPLTFKQKAIFFSLLLHSKRYASDTNSSFYMTYKQIKETANVSKPQLISDTITKLEEKNYIEIVRRNTQAEHQKEKLVNIYRITLDKEKSAQCVGRTSNAKEKTLKFTQCNSQTFKMVVNKLFTRTELQRFKLTATNIKYFKS